METIKMVSSDSLLQSVIISQNGDKLNALRELIQNGIDSYYGMSNEVGIHFSLSDDNCELTYQDYGCSFGNTIEETIQNFFVFGSSNKTIEQLGKFGIGRGQIIAALYDADSKQLIGEHIIQSGKFQIDNININNLTANISELEIPIVGTKWIIKSPTSIFTDDEMYEYLGNKIKCGIPIYYNEELINLDFYEDEYIHYQNDKFDLFINKGNLNDRTFKVYDRGIFVTNHWSNFHGFNGSIITRVPLELNFARNEIVDTSIWKEIKDKIIEFLLDYANQDNTTILEGRCDGVLTLLVQNSQESLFDKSIVKLANNSYTTINKIIKNGIIYKGERNTRLADAAITVGLLVIDDSSPVYYTYSFWEKLNIKIDFIEETSFAKRAITREFVPVKANTQEFKILSVLKDLVPLDQDERHLLIGKTSDIFHAWTNGTTEIYFNRIYIKSLNKLTLEQKLLSLIPVLAHEYAHNADNRIKDMHDYSFYNVAHDILRELVDKYLHSRQVTTK